MKQIKVFGTWWCGDCKRVLKVFNERQIDIEWIDIDKDPTGEKFVKDINKGNRSVPTIVFPDDTLLVEPSTQALNDKLNQGGF